jgi:NitT/TauT family transport system permease protein
MDSAVSVTSTRIAKPIRAGTIRKRRLNWIKRATPSVVFLVFCLLCWEYLPELAGIPEYILPRLSRVLSVYTDPSALALYKSNTLATLEEAIIGFVIGSSSGFLVAVVLTESRPLMNMMYPYIIALQCMPKVAIAPLLLVWFGFGIASKVLIVALLCFFPVLVNTMSGIRGVSREHIELFQAIRASRSKRLYHLVVPAALPSIFAGLEVAIVVSLIGAIVGEFVGAQEGLGVLILQAQFQMNIPGVFAILGILALLGVLFNVGIRIVRRRSLFWIAGEK